MKTKANTHRFENQGVGTDLTNWSVLAALVTHELANSLETFLTGQCMANIVIEEVVGLGDDLEYAC